MLGFIYVTNDMNSETPIQHNRDPLGPGSTVKRQQRSQIARHGLPGTQRYSCTKANNNNTTPRTIREKYPQTQCHNGTIPKTTLRPTILTEANKTVLFLPNIYL